MSSGYRNVLLKLAAPESIARIAPHLEPVDLKREDMIARPSDPFPYVYFMEDSLVSTVSHLDERRDVELGIVGREGFTGEAIVLGDDRSPFTVRVQMPGHAWRIPVEPLRQAVREDPGLHSLLLRFVRAQHLQLASTAAANQRGTVEERLARWLLMGFDRIDGDRFHATHETLAWLIAVRRPSITDALHTLEGRGVIRSVRNLILVRDEDGLRAVAGQTYGLAEREYTRLLGTDFRSHKRRNIPTEIPKLFVSGDSPQDEGD